MITKNVLETPKLSFLTSIGIFMSLELRISTSNAKLVKPNSILNKSQSKSKR
jgi:hypothetical protein